MKKLLLSISAIALGYGAAFAQCMSINCPSAIGVPTDSGMCSATVIFSAPTAMSTCTMMATDTFQYTGARQYFVVPAGVDSVTIETWGAQGGANWVNDVNFGGYMKGKFGVTPGDTLWIYVGQQPNGTTGGWNGGGNGETSGQGGGGATDVRLSIDSTLNGRIIVAGGGGGGGYWSSLEVVGGVGGGTNGANGYRSPDFATNPGGEGGTQTQGGPTGTCVSYNNPSCAGSFGQGGAPSGCGCEGYGGGGGWYGGAGSGNCRGGGGGSGYVLPTAVDTAEQSGIRIGNGMAVIGYNTITTPVVTQTGGLASGSSFPEGTTMNTFVATDAIGDSAMCSFAVTVADSEAPVLNNCPSDTTMCPGVVSFTLPTATDNCSGVMVQHTSGPNNGDNLVSAGTYPVTFTAIDSAGNMSTCTFTITVNACTGIQQYNNATFSLFPNPSTTGSFWLTSEGKGTFELRDVSGKIILAKQVTSAHQEINAGKLANGIYLARFTNDKGEVSNSRLVIQK